MIKNGIIVKIIISTIVIDKSTLAAIPTVNKLKYSINSYGERIGVLNLTIDKAPINPKDRAREDLTTVITSKVVKDRTTKVRASRCLSEYVFPYIKYILAKTLDNRIAKTALSKNPYILSVGTRLK